MFVSKRAECGLRILLALAKNQERICSARSLAESEGVPEQLVRLVLRDFSRAGLVFGQRGRVGGYKLAKRPEEIRLYHVFQVLGEAEVVLGRVGRGRAGPKSLPGSTPLPRFWRALEGKFWEVLQGQTLADLL